MCGLISLFAEHANVRFAASLNFEALNFGTQTIITDSIERLTQAAIINKSPYAAFSAIGGEYIPHIRKACEVQTDIIIDENANTVCFHFVVLKTFCVETPTDGAACAHKITIQFGELFFAQVCIAVTQLLVFCRVLKHVHLVVTSCLHCALRCLIWPLL